MRDRPFWRCKCLQSIPMVRASKSSFAGPVFCLIHSPFRAFHCSGDRYSSISSDVTDSSSTSSTLLLNKPFSVPELDWQFSISWKCLNVVIAVENLCDSEALQTTCLLWASWYWGLLTNCDVVPFVDTHLSNKLKAFLPQVATGRFKYSADFPHCLGFAQKTEKPTVFLMWTNWMQPLSMGSPWIDFLALMLMIPDGFMVTSQLKINMDILFRGRPKLSTFSR